MRSGAGRGTDRVGHAMRRVTVALLFVALVLGGPACGQGGAPGGSNTPGTSDAPSY